jgi:hypothetical protein
MTDKELMQMALDALHKSKAALASAAWDIDPPLEQPADEPLACDGSCEEHIGVTIPVIVEKWGKFTYCETAIAEDRARGLVVNPIEQPKESYPITSTPLYTSTQQQKPWVGLTDEEVEQVFPAIATYHAENKTLYHSIARAIEAKLKEKNNG